ncbi:hypothetical protein K474DRAFT_1677410 [Panus rudis PR-1116 ss-1]|nr:hypothetical protein K474DRAFT_1677410 [Panus rudis PR-1116 ss-1]
MGCPVFEVYRCLIWRLSAAIVLVESESPKSPEEKKRRQWPEWQRKDRVGRWRRRARSSNVHRTWRRPTVVTSHAWLLSSLVPKEHGSRSLTVITTYIYLAIHEPLIARSGRNASQLNSKHAKILCIMYVAVVSDPSARSSIFFHRGQLVADAEKPNSAEEIWKASQYNPILSDGSQQPYTIEEFLKRLAGRSEVFVAEVIRPFYRLQPPVDHDMPCIRDAFVLDCRRSHNSMGRYIFLNRWHTANTRNVAIKENVTRAFLEALHCYAGVYHFAPQGMASAALLNIHRGRRAHIRSLTMGHLRITMLFTELVIEVDAGIPCARREWMSKIEEVGRSQWQPFFQGVLSLFRFAMGPRDRVSTISLRSFKAFASASHS